MSHENVETVRAIYRAFARAESAQFARAESAQLMDFLDPEIEWLINPAAPEAGTHHGHEGVESWIADITETLSEFEIAPSDFLDAGEQVLCPVRIRVLGKASEAEVELTETHLWTITDGKAVRMQAYPFHAEALEAVGLSE
jgi:ketosteroid isomerase-like protein